VTECNGEELEFHGLCRRTVVARFDGGAWLLREVEAKTGFLAAIAEHCSDHRDPELIKHDGGELVFPRFIGSALGYGPQGSDDLFHPPIGPD
jgi:hypothetical protein